MLAPRGAELPWRDVAQRLRMRSGGFAAALATTAAAVACWSLVGQNRLETRTLGTNAAKTDERSDASTGGFSNVSKRYKLLCRSSMIPHPEKVKKGGEDAFFVEEDVGVVGVFDGVGGWASEGIDPGRYSKTLAQETAKNVRDRRDPLFAAQSLAEAAAGVKLPGTSTAIVVGLVDDSDNDPATPPRLVGVNVGDSGAIVVRDRKVVYRTSDLLHAFNFPYQVGYQSKDKVQDGTPINIPKIYEDDVILLATDGLFDNVFDEEVLKVLERYDALSGYEERNTVRVGAEKRMKGAADEIADLAFENSLSIHRQSPFQVAAKKAGYQYQGGKSDDITVVVCSICSRGDDDEEM